MGEGFVAGFKECHAGGEICRRSNSSGGGQVEHVVLEQGTQARRLLLDGEHGEPHHDPLEAPQACAQARFLIDSDFPRRVYRVVSLSDKRMRPAIPLKRFRMYAEGLDHPEGLAFDRDGTLWTGGELGQIYRIDGQGRPHEVVTLGGFNLGLTFSAKQELYVCNFGLPALVRMTRRGRVLQSWERVGSRKLINPNFSVFDSEGNLFFSDSGHFEEENACVYRVRANGRAEWFAGPLAFANGLSLSADERYLYVVQSTRDNVVKIEIRADEG